MAKQEKKPEQLNTSVDMEEKEETITAETRELIMAQCIKEILFSRRYKQGKIKNWQRNEEMYYGKKLTVTEARANVELGRMQEFVHTLLAKIDNPLVFKFQKRKESQLKRVKRLNGLRQQDQQNDFWDMKDLAGKKQGIIYGRCINAYHADSVNGYKPHLENVDVYDFLIDPSGGGLDIEQARYMGRYGVVKTREELEQGVEDGIYLEDVVKEITAGDGNNTEVNQEETNKRVRMYGQNTVGLKETQSDDKFKFWEWFTTYKGERYYLLMQEKGGRCVRIEKLIDLFTPTKDYALGMWPFWTWAAFMDLTEFWTPSYCDYVREILMAQNITINQMLDNAEAINKPQKIVNVNSIENMAELNYRRNGIIKVKGDIDANKAIQFVQVPPIQTPMLVFDKLEDIQQKASGVSSIENGEAPTDQKVGIYNGNEAQNADRFGLLNKSYSFGYQRFARLWEVGVRDHLTKKVAVEMIGPDGIETEEVSRKDIFRKADMFNVLVEASNAETMASARHQEAKTNFLIAQTKNPAINQKKSIEMQGTIVGFSESEMKELTDLSEFGNAELMSECARDIEALLDGDDVKLNQAANNAYRRKMIDYMIDHEEDMNKDQREVMIKYVKDILPIVVKNEQRAVEAYKNNLLNQMGSGVPAPAGAGPVIPSGGAAPVNNIIPAGK